MSDAPAAPWDVRLMDYAMAVMVGGAVLVCLIAAAWWVFQHPVFAIGRIDVSGDVEHNSAASLQANVVPLLQGNFITLNMTQARTAFESAPWVRRAVVRREFPNLLHVTLQEHVPVAYWGEDERQLVNTQGEIFDGQNDQDNQGDPDPGDSSESAESAGNTESAKAPSPLMPRLDGPSSQSAQVLRVYQRLAPLLKPLGLQLQGLSLLERGNWRGVLSQGGVIELGSGTPDELAARLSQFAHTAAAVAHGYHKQPGDIVSADLRHADGYALRLHGIPPQKQE